MPELPEIAAYLQALEPRIGGARLEEIRVRSVALLATWDPPLDAASGKRVVGLRRLGKRIVLALEDDLFLAIHLMIPGPCSSSRRGRSAGRASTC
jgi:formamidopyrimidine-DNA glycosylase